MEHRHIARDLFEISCNVLCVNCNGYAIFVRRSLFQSSSFICFAIVHYLFLQFSSFRTDTIRSHTHTHVSRGTLNLNEIQNGIAVGSLNRDISKAINECWCGALAKNGEKRENGQTKPYIHSSWTRTPIDQMNQH